MNMIPSTKSSLNIVNVSKLQSRINLKNKSIESKRKRNKETKHDVKCIEYINTDLERNKTDSNERKRNKTYERVDRVRTRAYTVAMRNQQFRNRSRSPLIRRRN